MRVSDVRPQADVRGESDHLGTAVAGCWAVGALLWALYTYFDFFYSIDEMMYPKCSTSTRLALCGIGIAVAGVTFAAVLLVRGIGTRGRPAMSARLITWSVALALWVGAFAFAAILRLEVSDGVLNGTCHL